VTMFEVKKRDGLARKSVFIHGDVHLSLPTACDPITLFPSMQLGHLTNVPLAAPPAFVKEYFDPGEGQPVPVHPSQECITGVSGDCVMIANWHTALSNPRNFAHWICSLKEKIPPDTAWYAPASALPSNAHILCYAGFDLFDFSAVDLKTAQDTFCMPEGEFPGSILGSGICGCEGCRKGDLSQHNRHALSTELSLIAHFIESQQMREFVESRCRMNAYHVAILRHLDNQRTLMEMAIPVARNVRLGAMSGDALNRAEIRRFADRVVRRYIPPPADTIVLLPCSWKKPYALSQSHRKFIQAVAGRALEVIVTSPLGVVPRELERCYPAAHYDIPVTGHWDREEKAFTARILREFLERHSFRRVIAHLEGGAMDAAIMAADELGIDPDQTCIGHPTSAASLAALEAACAGERMVKQDPVRGIGSWQFGVSIDTRGIQMRGRYPALFATKGKTQLFSLDTGTGLLRPTFDGWSLVKGVYRVEIEDFVPRGDVLAPGVSGADTQIREGDEVLVEGPSAFATGRSSMSAVEMHGSRRGVAVRVRTIKKIEHQ
jgi:archaeosine synthase